MISLLTVIPHKTVQLMLVLATPCQYLVVSASLWPPVPLSVRPCSHPCFHSTQSPQQRIPSKLSRGAAADGATSVQQLRVLTR